MFQALSYGLVAPTLPELQRIAHVDASAMSWVPTGLSLGQMAGYLLGEPPLSTTHQAAKSALEASQVKVNLKVSNKTCF